MKVTFLPLVLFSIPLLADTNLSALKAHAEKVATESQALKQVLKQKSPSRDEILSKVDVTKEGVAKIRSLVAEIESAQPAWLKSDAAAWEDLKNRAVVLAIMHERKAELTSMEAIRKQRGLLRAHVDGVAMRAEKIQQIADQLARKTGSVQ